jgi:molybdate transport system substrate-binding protein
VRRLAAATVAAAVLASCGGGAGARTGGSVTVFAASSLTEAFTALAGPVRSSRGLSLTFDFAGSQQLAAQIEQGAPADVVAAADRATLERLRQSGRLAGAPVAFATNRLEIVVRGGNPDHVTTLADLARPGLKVVLADPRVPAGGYAAQALARAGVVVHPVSLEDNVKAVVTKVGLGEADAGLAYVTDVRSAAASVVGVPLADAEQVVATYTAAVVKDAPHAGPARLFLTVLRSAAGKAVLQRFGFGPP